MFTVGLLVGFALGIGFTVGAWEIQMGRTPWPARLA